MLQAVELPTLLDIPQPQGECWGLGGWEKDTYVRIHLGDGPQSLHRYLYEQEVGPIPDGLVPDHLCNHKWCLNWDHIELVTQAENMRRAYIRTGRVPVCKYGHAFTPENTYWFQKRPGVIGRQCRTCNQRRNHETRLRARRVA